MGNSECECIHHIRCELWPQRTVPSDLESSGSWNPGGNGFVRNSCKLSQSENRGLTPAIFPLDPIFKQSWLSSELHQPHFLNLKWSIKNVLCLSYKFTLSNDLIRHTEIIAQVISIAITKEYENEVISAQFVNHHLLNYVFAL